MSKEHFESHMTAHSSEILPWLYLGGLDPGKLGRKVDVLQIFVNAFCGDIYIHNIYRYTYIYIYIYIYICV